MNVGIIGLGLMGGSLGRVLISKGHTVFGEDINPEVISKAFLMKAISNELNFDNAKTLDTLVCSVYPSDFEKTVTPYLPYLKKGALVIDFCGTKGLVVSVMEKMSQKYADLTFIGGHPMAGREFSGIERSSVNLFNKASMVFVPVNADIFALDFWKKFFLSIGFSKVVFTTAQNHDEMIAYTSQLCHIVSNAFIKSPTAKNHFGYSAGSFRDLTRVAKLSSTMWTELMLENKQFLSAELDTLINSLSEYSSALKNNDADLLKKLLQEGNDTKLLIDSNQKNN